MANFLNIKSASAEETKKIAQRIIKNSLNLIQKDGLTIFLKGDLGAGKTVFAQGIAQALKIKERINSPSFIIFKKFQNKQGIVLVHIDCYRLKKKKDLEILGLESYFNQPKYLVVIEWPWLLKEWKRKIKNLIEIHLKHSPKKEKGRLILIKKNSK